jgi:hypothetical protein
MDLPVPGGPMSKYVMPAGGGDFQGALHVFLALDFGKIQLVLVLVLENFGDVHFGRRDFDFAFEKLRGFAQILHRNDLQAGDDRRFGGIFRRHEHAGFAVGFRANRHRQNPLHGTHRAGQREFARR